MEIEAMGDARVTVVVVPRERFGMAARSLASVLDRTAFPFEMVYVDGGSPARVAEAIEAEAERHDFTLVRTEHYLSPNEARNLAMEYVSTPYVVFVDNDVMVEPGWLEALVRCADETGAWVVGPFYCDGEPPNVQVHMSGGRSSIVEVDGVRTLRHAHFDAGAEVEVVRARLVRGPTELIEFHAVLVRRDVFDRLGPLDEALLSAHEHVDLCMQVRDAGGVVYVEPASVITYVPPVALERDDCDYFRLRWSVAWNEATVVRFREKWDLGPGAVSNLGWWLDKHRRLAMGSAVRVTGILGRRVQQLIDRVILAPWERRQNLRQFPVERNSRRPSWATQRHRLVVDGRRQKERSAA